MLGGVIGGYCASGRLSRATAPARVMTIDSTAAKIGRSMKKCENMADPNSTHADRKTRNHGHGSREKSNYFGLGPPGGDSLSEGLSACLSALIKRTSDIFGGAGAGCSSASTIV